MDNVGSKEAYIRLDANHSRGMGHLFRMLVLGEQLSYNGFAIKFVITENAITEDILRDRGYEFLSFSNACDEEHIISHSLRNKPLPSLWIFDILRTEAVWINLVRSKNIKVICFDDTKGGLNAAHIVINSIVHSWGVYNTEKISVPIFEGTRYAIINPAVHKLRKKRITNRNRPIRIGITMGGSDTYGSTLNIVKALSEVVSLAYECHIFTGPHFLHQKQLAEVLANLPGNFTVHQFVNDLYKELDSLDVVICGGGSTLFEICAMGLPALAYANELHEEKTITYLFSLGLCHYIGTVRRLEYKELGEKIQNSLFDVEALNAMSNAAYEHFAVNGAEECVRAILNFMNDSVEVGKEMNDE